MKKMALLSALLALATGCSTIVNNHGQKEDMMAAYLAGNDAKAAETLKDKLKEPSAFNLSVVGSGDEVCWRVEGGAHKFLTGDYAGSISDFGAAKSRIEEYENRAIVNLRQAGSETAGLLTNPCALPYRAFSRDRVMIPVFTALDYLAQGDEEGFNVELNAIRTTQQDIMDKNAAFFEAEKEATEKAKAKNAAAAKSCDTDKVLKHANNASVAAAIEKAREVSHRGYAELLNPLATFLSGWGYLRQGDAQNACIDFIRLKQALPQNALVSANCVAAIQAAGKDLPASLASVAPAPAPNGSVLVIVANGRSAAFRQVSLYLPIVIPSNPILATVAWPVPEYYTAPYSRIQVVSDGVTFEALPVADMDAIICSEYMDRLPGMITRIVLSTAAKETAAYFANEAARRAGTVAHVVTWIATASYKVTFNTADTRSWEMLPKEYRLAQLPLPQSGRFTVSLDGRPVEVSVPAGSSSAIVYVNAPSASATSVRVLPFK